MPVLLNTTHHSSLVTEHFFAEENMPYIRGRYYMNPVVGDALEAAREAEAALQALEHAAKVARGDTGDDDPGLVELKWQWQRCKRQQQCQWQRR